MTILFFGFEKYENRTRWLFYRYSRDIFIIGLDPSLKVHFLFSFILLVFLSIMHSKPTLSPTQEKPTHRKFRIFPSAVSIQRRTRVSKNTFNLTFTGFLYQFLVAYIAFNIRKVENINVLLV